MPEPDSPDTSQNTRKRNLLNLFGLIGPAEAETSALNLLEPASASSDLIDHARAFQNLKVSDVMTPRVDIIAVELSSPLSDLVGICVESEHSRLPIYRETLDDPLGVVHIKDVLKILAPKQESEVALNWADQVLHRIRRELIYVPASMSASDLLLKMQHERIHMALVIDEFGGTDGLVTLEDLLEAVVGDIADEYDEDQTDDLHQTGLGLIEAGGRVELKVLEERLDLKLYPDDSEEEIDTLAGLVTMLAGRVPQRGEVIPYPKAGIDIEVLDADARRIKRLRLHKRNDVVSADLDPSDD
jgi:CBS domain containing-hemolysin-like protein